MSSEMHVGFGQSVLNYSLYNANGGISMEARLSFYSDRTCDTSILFFFVQKCVLRLHDTSCSSSRPPVVIIASALLR